MTTNDQLYLTAHVHCPRCHRPFEVSFPRWRDIISLRCPACSNPVYVAKRPRSRSHASRSASSHSDGSPHTQAARRRRTPRFRPHR